MRLFEASIETIILRYYLLMAVTIIPVVIGIPMLAILALPVFLSALMGVSFTNNGAEAKIITKEREFTKAKAAA